MPTATILAGNSTSEFVSFGTARLLMIVAPRNWTPAELSFQVSQDGVSISNYVIIGQPNILAIPFQANRAYSISRLLPPVMKLRLLSGTVGNPIKQEADRIIGLFTDSATG
jgi:hypothetical protein